MMLVDSRGILLFFPRLLCSFLIFFYFYISSLGLLSRRTKFPAFLSIRALRLDIFSITSLRRPIVTARSAGPGTIPRTGEGSRCPGCFRRLAGRGRSFSGFRRSCRCCFFPCLGKEGLTHGEDVVRLLADLPEYIFMLLSQKISHLVEPFYLRSRLRSIMSSVISARKSSIVSSFYSI
jgi:hypothetical protein